MEMSMANAEDGIEMLHFIANMASPQNTALHRFIDTVMEMPRMEDVETYLDTIRSKGLNPSTVTIEELT